ncbi:MAG: hypothetical protein J0L94_04850 [Rhodothermia bacterium]|nr:hypothetical protein [Rhodothermia bacterium]
MRPTSILFLCLLFWSGKVFAQGNTNAKITGNPYLGEWNYKILDTPDGDMVGKLILKVDGKGQLTNDAFLAPAAISQYVYSEEGLTFSTKVSLANGYTFNCTFSGELKSGELKGKLEVMEMGRTFEVVASRSIEVGIFSGKWSYTIYNTPQGDLSGVLTILEEGSGTLANDAFIETALVKQLVVEGNTLTFKSAVTVADGQTFSINFIGTSENNLLNGSLSVLEIGQDYVVKGKRILE